MSRPKITQMLQPDEHGHYSPASHELDQASHRHLALGRHPMDGLAREMAMQETRRRFFARGAQGIGGLALASLLGGRAEAAQTGGLAGLPHFPPKAKRCIYLHLMGAPPQ